MKIRKRHRILSIMLTLLLCLTALPQAAIRTDASETLEIEPVVLLMEDLSKMVTEIPIGKDFGTSMNVGEPDSLETVSLVGKDTQTEYLLYDHGAVGLGGREYSPEEGPYFMVNFSSDNIIPGKYVIRVVNGGVAYTDPTVFTFVAGEGYVPGPAISTTSLVDATEGASYRDGLQAQPKNGGKITWSITAGRLPKGLMLNADTGVISGVPTEQGYFSFTVTAKEANGRETNKELSILVHAIPTYSADFRLNGGTAAAGANYDRRTVKSGMNVVMPAAPTKSGNKFVGWKCGSALYLPGASVTVTADMAFIAEFTAQDPLRVSLPQGFAPLAGALWLEGTCDDGSVLTLWSGYVETGAPEILVPVYLLVGRTYTSLKLFAYINDEKTALASFAGKVTEGMTTVTLQDAGVKREILRGVTVSGLTEGADYTVGRVSWQNGTAAGDQYSFPVMVKPGNRYSVRLRGVSASPVYSDYRWEDVYTNLTLSDGRLTVRPAPLSADAVVGGNVTLDGAPLDAGRLTATQSAQGILRSVSTFLGSGGTYSLRLLPGVPAVFTLEYDGEPFIVSGGNLTAPANGVTHSIAAKSVKCAVTVAPQTVSSAEVATRYMRALDAADARLRFDLSLDYSHDYAFHPSDFAGSLQTTRVVSAHFASADGSQPVLLEETEWLTKAEANVTYSKGEGAVMLKPSLNPGVVVSLSSVTTGHYFLAWFDASGAYIGRSYGFTLNAAEKDVSSLCPAKKAGKYTVALLSEVYCSEEILAPMTAVSLSSGLALKTWNVTLRDTEIAALPFFGVNAVDSENALFVTKPHSTLSADKKHFADKGELVAFRGTVGLDPGLSAGKLDVLRISAGVNGSPRLVPVTLVVNGKVYPLSGRDDGLTVDFAKLAKSGTGNGPVSLPCTYTLYATPFAMDRDMQLELYADVSYVGGRRTSEPIGTATVRRPAASLETLSAYVCGENVTLSGTAQANGTVSVYDNGKLIGKGGADGAGRWKGSFRLQGTDPAVTTTHTLYAVSGSTKSELLTLIHRQNGPELKELTMVAGGHDVPANTAYTIGLGSRIANISFRARFEHPNMLRVMPRWNCKVVIKVFLGNGEIRYLKAKEGKNGNFTADLGDVYSYIAGAEALFLPAEDKSIAQTNAAGTTEYYAADEYVTLFGPLHDLLVQNVNAEASKRPFWFGLNAANNMKVTFKNGSPSVTCATVKLPEGVTSDGMKAGYTEAAKKLSSVGLTLQEIDVKFKDKENVFTWLNDIAAAQAVAAKSGVFIRSNLFASEKAYNNTKTALEPFAVNPEYNDNAGTENHISLSLGKNRIYDLYRITDIKHNDKGKIVSGTYDILVSFCADSSAGATVYSSSTVVLADGNFGGYKGIRKTENVVDQLKRNIYVFHNGKFSEDKVYEMQSKMGSNAGDFAFLADLGGTLLESSRAAQGWVKTSGLSLGIAGLGAGIISLVQNERDAHHRIAVRSELMSDMNSLMDSPCYKRLTDEEKAACNDAFDRFITAHTKYDTLDGWFAPVNFTFNITGVLLSLGGLIPYYGKLAAKVGAGVSIVGYAHGTGGAVALKAAQEELVRQYEDAYREIGDIFQNHADRNNIDDCKKITINPKVNYYPHFDPSGIVYEGVIENPVQDAKVTLWYGVDAAGKLVLEKDAKNVKKVVPAADVTDKTPTETEQRTGADGRYAWFVPQGLWYVTAEKAGLTGNSNADRAATVKVSGVAAAGKSVSSLLPVLPVQLDVNIPLVDRTAPTVTAAVYTDEGIYVTFSKYMVDTAKGADSVLNPANYTLTTAAGKVEIGSVKAVEQGHTPANIDGLNTKTYTRTVLVVPKNAVKTGTQTLLTVKKTVKSYAGSAMTSDFSDSGTVASKKTLGAPVIAGGAKQTVALGSGVTISLPKDVPENARIFYTVDGAAPTTNGSLYAGPFGVFNNMTVKAIVVCPGYQNSAAAASEIRIGEGQQYTLAGDVLTQGTASVAGLTVTLTGGSYTKIAKVSADGSYVFADVPVGSYTLSFAGSDAFEPAAVTAEVATGDPWVNLTLTSKQTYTPGDVDGNGEIEVTDARYALRAAVGLENYEPGMREFLAADTDGNGEIEVSDARNILRAAVGLDQPADWKK